MKRFYLTFALLFPILVYCQEEVNSKDEEMKNLNSRNPVLISKFSGNISNGFVARNINFTSDKKSELTDVLFLFTYKDGAKRNPNPETIENIVQQFKNWIETSVKGNPIDLDVIKSDSLVIVELVITADILKALGVNDAMIKTRVNITKNGSQLVDKSFERGNSAILPSNDPNDVLESAISRSKNKIASILSAYMKIE
jgi:hypothetical protein